MLMPVDRRPHIVRPSAVATVAPMAAGAINDTKELPERPPLANTIKFVRFDPGRKSELALAMKIDA